MGLKLHETGGTTTRRPIRLLPECRRSLRRSGGHSLPTHLNESAFVEDTTAAIKRGRVIHTTIPKVAGGGHAPDIKSRPAASPTCCHRQPIPLGPTPSNTVDEHLDYADGLPPHLDPAIAEDVGLCDSRPIRRETHLPLKHPCMTWRLQQ